MVRRYKAKVAELVDALALGASGVTRESSSLSFRTNYRGCLSHPGSGKYYYSGDYGVAALAGKA